LNRIEWNRFMGKLSRLTKIKPQLETIQQNQEEIYKISRKLPEDEGYKLIQIHNQSLTATSEAWKKYYQSK